MNELQQTVNARELHAFLQSKQDFSTWIKNRVEKYCFVENQDFIKLHKKVELSKTGQIGFHFFVEANKVFIFHKKMENPQRVGFRKFHKKECN